ncbi:MAG: DUF6316 family protein [Gammaproteobacteria bacterium]|nr:DUF6316 family protein [Gammaproteobacteria bacterium]
MRIDDHNDGTHFRSGDRVFCMNGEWFFQTREDDHGPYHSRGEAEIELARYAKEMNYLDTMDKPPAQDTAPSNGHSADPSRSDRVILDKR